MVRVIACQAILCGFKSHFFRLYIIIKLYINDFYFIIFMFINIYIFLIFSFILSILLFYLSFFFIKKKNDLEKLSSYECGFNPYNDARKIFDIKFYLIAILFIIFDLETIFIFPWILTLNINYSLGFWIMFEFLIELIIGFIYAWSNNSFN